MYGTLRAGEINDIRTAALQHGLPEPVWVGQGTVAGLLYDFGAYPGWVATQTSQHSRVLGDIYAISPALIQVLDEIEEVYPGESGLFLQKQILLECQDQILQCIAYPVHPDKVVGLPVIPNGDWVSYRATRDAWMI